MKINTVWNTSKNGVCTSWFVYETDDKNKIFRRQIAYTSAERDELVNKWRSEWSQAGKKDAHQE
jgi:hypothetical protein